MSTKRASVRTWFVRWSPLAVLLTAWIGCSSQQGGVKRFDMSGKVVYGGAPVPAGEIVFLPDGEQGNQGPGGVAEIKDGAYRTVRGKGPTAGPHIAVLTGYDQGDPTVPGGSPPILFTEVRVKVDVLADKPTLDFDLPRQ